MGRSTLERVDGFLPDSQGTVETVRNVALNSLREGSLIAMFYNNNPRTEAGNIVVLTVSGVENDEGKPTVSFDCVSLHAPLNGAFYRTNGQRADLDTEPDKMVLRNGFSSQSALALDRPVIAPNYDNIISGQSYWFQMSGGEGGFVIARGITMLRIWHPQKAQQL